MFLYVVCMFKLSLSLVSDSINDLLAFEMHLGILNSPCQEFTS